MTAREVAFKEYVQGGGQVETGTGYRTSTAPAS